MRGFFYCFFSFLVFFPLFSGLDGVRCDGGIPRSEKIKALAGERRTLTCLVGEIDPRLMLELYDDNVSLIHGLSSTERDAEEVLRLAGERGLQGRIVAEPWSGSSLPYPRNWANLLVVEKGCGLKKAEMMRVLAPGCVALVGREGKWERLFKPWPDQIDEWTHFLHDASGNALARDEGVGPPRSFQWIADPLYSRSHEIDSSLPALISAGGRLFYVMDEGPVGIIDQRFPCQWSLFARDAFNGLLLWKRPLDPWGWREWKREELEGKDWTRLHGQRGRFPREIPRRLVSDGQRVYMTLGYTEEVTILDAATGETVQVCEGTRGAHEMVLSQGILLVRISEELSERDSRRGEKRKGEALMALDAATGKLLWRKETPRLHPLSLAASGGRTIYYGGGALVCHRNQDGEVAWQKEAEAPQSLMVQDGVVLAARRNRLLALSLENGELLWEGPGPHRIGAGGDLFVADGIVWMGRPTKGFGDPDHADTHGRSPETGVLVEGRTLKDGRLVKQVEVDNVMSPGHHFRCYSSKATSRYLLWPKRGVEFIDLKGENHMRHDWIRGSCRYGVMPSNGLLYVPPDPCFCYIEAKVNGFLALSSQPVACPTEARESRDAPSRRQAGGGPDPGKDWPTFRHDPLRSGTMDGSTASRWKVSWSARIGGKLTQPVTCQGCLLVAQKDRHTLHAFNAETGERIWGHVAGGRIDSPPTIHQGRVLVGCHDGWVTCLDLEGGKILWRFQAAPGREKMIAFGQLESRWPVAGSVLCHRHEAYVCAGRSTFLDGGIFLYGLDPGTGEVLHSVRLHGPFPDLSKDIGRPYNVEGGVGDVLVTDGDRIYLRHMMLSPRLEVLDALETSRMGDKRMGRHLFSTSTLLDDTWWNRTYWMYSTRWPGFNMGNQAPKAGQILVFDEEMTCGLKVYTERNRHSPMFFPETRGYLLFADSSDNEPILAGEPGAPEPVKWLPEVKTPAYGYRGHHFTNEYDDLAFEMDKGTGFTRCKPPLWQQWIPVRARAMVLSDNALLLAGPPDVLDPNDPLAALEGRKGGILQIRSRKDGHLLGEVPLDAPPVFDGLIGTENKLYLSDERGEIICFQAEVSGEIPRL